MKAKRVSVALMLAVLLAAHIPVGAEGEQERKEIKPVLLVVDVQNQWMPMMAQEDRASAPGKINEAIALFREYGQPVIRVYHSDPKLGPEPDTDAFDFPDSIAVLESDPKVVKAHPSSFMKTDLEKMLRDGERNVVILCGLSAVGCVLATYFGAMEREFTVLMVKEALLSHNAEYTDMVENICYSMSLEDLEEMLEDPYF
ncbi:MAG: isochorismatase family cysteine hydrolase [bacterium]|jgi:nicotinamidase-related amidase